MACLKLLIWCPDWTDGERVITTIFGFTPGEPTVVSTELFGEVNEWRANLFIMPHQYAPHCCITLDTSAEDAVLLKLTCDKLFVNRRSPYADQNQPPEIKPDTVVLTLDDFFQNFKLRSAERIDKSNRSV